MTADQKPPLLPLEALLSNVVTEFDAKPNAFGEFEVVDKMRFVLGNRILSEAERALYYGESNAFFFRARMNEDDPFSGYFQPTFGTPKPDGTTSWIPDPRDLTPEMIGRWKNHLDVCKHSILRARYADLLWSFQKQIANIAPAIDLARIAITSYLEASRLADSAVKNATDWLSRAIALSVTINDASRIEQSVEAPFVWLGNNGQPNFPGTWVFLFTDIYDNKRVETRHKSRVIAYLETVLSATTDITGESLDHFAASNVSALLATHFRREGNETEVKRVIGQAGKATEYVAAQASPLMALAWLQPLMELYRDAGMAEDAARVQVEGRRRGAASKEDIKGQSYSFEIPKEVIDKYLQFLMEPIVVEERIRRWAVSNVQNVEKAQKNLLDSLTQTPLLARIGITAMQDGQYVAKAGSVEDDLDSRLAAHLRQLIELNSQLFVGSWFELTKAGGVDSACVLELIKGSPVFDQTGIDMISQGIDRFFAEDHLAATHILVPQVERGLRTVLGLLGRPTNKAIRGEKGTMQEQNMNDALTDVAMKNLLPVDWQRHLQIVFASRLGFNLRNLIAHGLLPADQFSIYTSLLTLQGLFLLAQIEATDTSA